MSEAAPTLGQRLKAAREAKGLSAQKAADELHLDAWVVEALESGDYARIGPAVYAKGHLKRYAGLLGLPAAAVVDGFSAQSAPPPIAAPPPTVRMPGATAPGRHLPWLPIAALVGVGLVVAGVMGWRQWPPRSVFGPAPGSAAVSPATPATEPAGVSKAVLAAVAASDVAPATGQATTTGEATPAGQPTLTRQATSPGQAGAADDAANGKAVTLAASDGDAAAVPVRSAEPAGSGRARLRLSFSADSWVDVHDAAGQRVYAGNAHANNVRTISGAAPLRVYLKSAGGVQLEINNRAVAIGPQFLAGDIAHFEAGADGVLRRDTHAGGAHGAPARTAAPALAPNPRPRG